MLSEVVTCNWVRNPGGHAEPNPRPSEEGVSWYHVLRPLDLNVPLHTTTRIQRLGGVDAYSGCGSLHHSHDLHHVNLTLTDLVRVFPGNGTSGDLDWLDPRFENFV